MTIASNEPDMLNTTLTVHRCDAVPKWELNFIWNPYIPAGEITMLYGDSDVGKSTVCCKIAADISTGTQLPGGSIEKPGKVLYISADLTEYELVRLLTNSGANFKNVYLYSAVMKDSVCDLLGTHVDKLQQIVSKIKPNLIIVDDCLSFMGTANHPITLCTIKEYWLKWLQLCTYKTCGLLLVVPNTKQASLKNDAGETTFSTIYNQSRSVLCVVAPESDSNAACVLVHQKANYSALSQSINVCIDDSGITWGDYSVINRRVLEYVTQHHCSVDEALTHFNVKM